jgi:hypothetical protein
MKAVELIEAIKRSYPEIQNDSQVANLLGLTAGRLSQLRSKNGAITPRQVVSVFKRIAKNSEKTAFDNCIKPVVEFYPVDCTASRGDSSWEIIPSNKNKNPRQSSLRSYLESAKGIYFFYNSEGEVIYSGKTEKQSLWKEMNVAFNRERSAHNAFLVDHPTKGKTFQPAWQKLRQPSKRTIYLCDTASYFSAYDVAQPLISSVESLIIRAICNDISNVRMERFKFKL